MFLDRLLLRLTHSILDLGVFVCQFTIVIWSMAINFVLYRKRKKMSQQCIPESPTERNVLRKLPQHIAFIITESKLSYKDLANLIIWAVELGISYVSVYDPCGEIKRNNKILKHLIQQKNKKTDSSRRFDIQISTDLQEYKASVKVFNVAVLSLEDGRQGLVHVTKQLSSQVLANRWSIADIVPNSVNKLIQESYGFPDPELIVRFGNISSLIGFLPWQVRLSEILSLPTHHGFDYYLFRRTLTRYGCLEQRFGK